MTPCGDPSLTVLAKKITNKLEFVQSKYGTELPSGPCYNTGLTLCPARGPNDQRYSGLSMSRPLTSVELWDPIMRKQMGQNGL